MNREGENKTPEGYHYVECGLSNVWLLNGYSLHETPYGPGVSIKDMSGLHACIAGILCDKPDSLTGAEFKYLRVELDFSQRLIGEIIGITDRQIRRLEEKPEQKIKEPYNRLIRHLYLTSISPVDSSYISIFKRLSDLDVEWHEKLTLSPNGDSGNWSWREPPNFPLSEGKPFP